MIRQAAYDYMFSFSASAALKSFKRIIQAAAETGKYRVIIIDTPEELKTKKKRHSYSISLPIQRPKDSDIIGICVPKKEAEECRCVILEALKKASLSDETRELLRLQFQNSSLTI